MVKDLRAYGNARTKDKLRKGEKGEMSIELRSSLLMLDLKDNKL